MPHTSRWIRTAGLLVLTGLAGLTALAACGTAGPANPAASAPSVAPTSPPTAAATTGAPATPSSTTVAPRPPTGLASLPLSVTRSGGFAGVMETIQVAPDGSWVYRDRKAGTSRPGHLAATQRQQLARLLADPAFAREVRRSPPTGGCNDGFVYSLMVGELAIRYDQCETAGNRPMIDAVVDLIVGATPL